MSQNQIMKSKDPLRIFKTPTKICKICLKPTSNFDIFSFINKDYCICPKCRNNLKPLFSKFRVVGINGLAIYEYDEEIKTLLYQLKGCYDIELAPVFFERYHRELHTRFHNYYLVPAPSYHEDDEKREFKHVIEIFRCLKLPFLEIVEKFSPFKQADHKAHERKQIAKHLRLVEQMSLYGKNILIVDDVFTTGSTIKSMIKLIKSLKPKKIEILVMSKTSLKEKT